RPLRHRRSHSIYRYPRQGVRAPYDKREGPMLMSRIELFDGQSRIEIFWTTTGAGPLRVRKGVHSLARVARPVRGPGFEARDPLKARFPNARRAAICAQRPRAPRREQHGRPETKNIAAAARDAPLRRCAVAA